MAPAARSGFGFDRVDAMMVGLVLIWGTAFPGIQYLERTLDPFQLTWYRYVPFPLLYGAYLLLRRRAVFRAVSGLDWIRMGLLGFLGVVGYHFSLNWAMAGDGAVSPATGALLVATTPLWTLGVSVATGRENARPLAVLGSVLAFAGVVLVVLKGHGDAEVTVAAKAGIGLLAPLSWALYSIYTKPIIAKHGGLFVTGTTLSLGVATLLPLAFWYGTAPLAALDGQGWFWLAFLALLSTALGYAMWNHAIKQRAASSVATYIYFNPVVAALAALALAALDPGRYPAQPMTPYFVLGGALVIVGVLVVNRARLPPAAAAKP
ncbi:MAG: hypothetical protein QOD77_802 [Thermoplasmata archaeon]|jgi:drug/metabolite transporter (DMT)-like permease|nr:hypothetical protein [Thermoplasmata archaeon]